MQYPPEYEMKMANGLRSSFITLAFVVLGLFSIVAGVFLSISAFLSHEWLLLASFPIGFAASRFFWWVADKAQEWGLKELDEAKQIQLQVTIESIKNGS